MFYKKFLANRNGLFIVLAIAFLTAIAGEIRVVPFEEVAFRFGFGSITFFLLILIWTPKSIVQTGLITAISVVVFRMIEDMLFRDIEIAISFKTHFPTFVFYFLFALGLQMIKIERFKASPLELGALATLFEFLGNGMEELIRLGIGEEEIVTLQEWAIILIVALFRSYFVVGIYSSITVSEQKKQMEEILGVGSGLYAETLYLQKSMNHIEQITASSYDLYRQLKKVDQKALSIHALHISQEIHEVKKDAQRILAGLSKITMEKRDNPLFISDILHLVVSANEKYSEFLKKTITFHINIEIDFETNEQIPLLAILNNLTSNAVEATEKQGVIEVHAKEVSANICFVIKDTGKGIRKEDVSLVFEPGYTTKYNEHGFAATGIGLSHVKAILEKLEGRIDLESSKLGTVFTILIPQEQLRKRVE